MEQYDQFLVPLLRKLGLDLTRPTFVGEGIALQSKVQDFSEILPAVVGVRAIAGTAVMVPPAGQRASLELLCNAPTLITLFESFTAGTGPAWHVNIVDQASSAGLASATGVVSTGVGDFKNEPRHGATAVNFGTGGTFWNAGGGNALTPRGLFVEPGKVFQLQRGNAATLDQFRIAWIEFPEE